MAATSLLEKFLTSLTPRQICWLCLFVTITGAGIGSTYALKAFASTESVTQVRAQVTRIEVRQIERDIFDRQAQVCQAIAAGQSPRVYRERLQEALRAYEELTGKKFDLPSCEEL